MKNYFVNKVAIPTISKNSVLKELVNGVFSGLWMNEDEKIESIMKLIFVMKIIDFMSKCRVLVIFQIVIGAYCYG